MARRSIWATWVALGGAMALAGVSGCAGKKEPPPFTAPQLELKRVHFAGTPLSGPTTRPTAPFAADQAWRVHVVYLALEQMPPVGQPLGAAARLVVADRAGGPILPSGVLTRDSRLIDLKDTDDAEAKFTAMAGVRTARIGVLDGVLPEGVTAAFTTAESSDGGAAMFLDRQQRQIEVSVCRPAASRTAPTTQGSQEIELGLMVDQRPSRTQAQEQSESPPTTRPALQRELALVDRQMAAGREAVALVVPMRFGTADAVAAVIQVMPPADDAADRQVVAQAWKEAVGAADHASERPRIAPLAIADAPGFSVVIATLAQPQSRRAALAFLAARTDSPLIDDLSLVGDDAALQAFAERIQKQMPAVAAAKTPDELGWLLERTALAMMAERLDAGALSPELAAVLTRHAGEAGRQPASIQEVLRSSPDRATFRSRIIAENLIYLEDASPGARVRAYDWLASRGHAPAGFDPLGSARQRRDAMDKMRAGAAAGGRP